MANPLKRFDRTPGKNETPRPSPAGKLNPHALFFPFFPSHEYWPSKPQEH